MHALSRTLRSELEQTLQEAVESRRGVKLYVENTFDPDRPAREVEGIVVEVAVGRDARSRVRVAIPTGAGDPVEVRVLLDSIQRFERVDLPGAQPWPTESGPRLRPSSSIFPRGPDSGPVRRPTKEFGRE